MPLNVDKTVRAFNIFLRVRMTGIPFPTLPREIQALQESKSLPSWFRQFECD